MKMYFIEIHLQIILSLVKDETFEGSQDRMIWAHQLSHVGHHRRHLVVHQGLDVQQRCRKADLKINEVLKSNNIVFSIDYDKYDYK